MLWSVTSISTAICVYLSLLISIQSWQSLVAGPVNQFGQTQKAHVGGSKNLHCGHGSE